jgi:hypothetical protein
MPALVKPQKVVLITVQESLSVMQDTIRVVLALNQDASVAKTANLKCGLKFQVIL